MFPTTSLSRTGRALTALGRCPETHAYLAVPLGGAGAFIGRDQQDRVALFLPSHDRRLPLRLGTDLLSLSLGVTCTLAIPHKHQVIGRFDVLRCETSDAATLEPFVLFADALVAQAADQALAPEVLPALFRGLSRIFQASPDLDLLSARQGLWGELFLIRHLGGPQHWMRFWHSDPYRRWDFSYGSRRIEVKTSREVGRIHTFAHRQLFASSEDQVAIASLLLQANEYGLSLRRLIDETRRVMGSEINDLLKLEASVRVAGMALPTDEGPAFDESAAERSLLWYWATDVPRFTRPEPAGVTDTHYRVDLSGTATISIVDIEAWLQTWVHR